MTYNCTEPGFAFVGRERLRRDLAAGLRDGHSFAVLGGRRIGKTSLLLQLGQDLQAADAPLRPLYFSIHHVGRVSTDAIFAALYDLLMQDAGGGPAWRPAGPAGAFHTFLALLDEAAPRLRAAYGDGWRAVLLLDDLDTAIDHLDEDDLFFQNLRHLLSAPTHRHRFCAVGTGAGDLARCIASGSSPLNVLRRRTLGVLTPAAAGTLVRRGHPDGLGEAAATALYGLTGRHPFLLQAVLEHVPLHPTVGDVHRAAAAALEQHQPFPAWARHFDEAVHAVYAALATAPEPLTIDVLRKTVSAARPLDVEDALRTLAYHGVIDRDGDELRANGVLFRGWYRRLQSLRPPEPDMAFAERFHGAVHDRLADASLDVSALAHVMGMSRRVLHREVRDNLRTTPMQYVLAQRMDTARSLLQTTSKNVSQVAYAVGYGNASSFSAAYLRFYGERPSEA